MSEYQEFKKYMKQKSKKEIIEFCKETLESLQRMIIKCDELQAEVKKLKEPK